MTQLSDVRILRLAQPNIRSTRYRLGGCKLVLCDVILGTALTVFDQKQTVFALKPNVCGRLNC
jgi:hypothetical protein